MKHWTKRIVHDHWLFLACPTMEDKEAMKNFKTRLQIYRELKEIEKEIIDTFELKGWLCKTWIGNIDVLKLLWRMGAKEYKNYNNYIYFQMNLKGNWEYLRNVQ